MAQKKTKKIVKITQKNREFFTKFLTVRTVKKFFKIPSLKSEKCQKFATFT